jgi:hypothetical protein
MTKKRNAGRVASSANTRPQKPNRKPKKKPDAQASLAGHQSKRAIVAKPTGPRERVRIGQAMRERGLDEHLIAEMFAAVVGKLHENNSSDSGSVQKLLVDVLKECSRHLDPPREAGRDTSEGPATIILIHEVDRPVRELPAVNETAVDETTTDATPADEPSTSERRIVLPAEPL